MRRYFTLFVRIPLPSSLFPLPFTRPQGALFLRLQLCQHVLPRAEPGKHPAAHSANSQMGCQVDAKRLDYRPQFRFLDQDHQDEAQKQERCGRKHLWYTHKEKEMATLLFWFMVEIKILLNINLQSVLFLQNK